MAQTHALVIGGSLAGLCAGRVLLDHFDRVTVLERDELPDGPVERAGAPQSRHVHALLLRGKNELEGLFPGFVARMLAGGALDLDFNSDAAQLRGGGWVPPRESGFRVLFASRALVESCVRTGARTLERLEISSRIEVAGLIGDSERVIGVRTRPRDGGPVETLAADLVVDCSGRTSRAPVWLRELGSETPEETVIDSKVGYATRWYEAPESERWPSDWWWKAAWIESRPDDPPRGAVLFPVEGRRWLVTQIGWPGSYAGSDEESFEADLWQQASPVVAEAVKLGRPLSGVTSYRQMANRYRHYERLRAPAAGFVALGDAFCAFNPVYGQGMTTAAISARALGRVIAKTGTTSRELPRETFRELARVLAGPWMMTTGADAAIPFTEGPVPRTSGLVKWYMDELQSTVMENPRLLNRFLEVIHMLREPTALFAPRMVTATVFAAARRKLLGRGLAVSRGAMPPAYVQKA